MDETRIDYCSKCIDDHEDRLRAIERDHSLIVRVEVLETYMKNDINSEFHRKEDKADVYALIGMVISIATFVILVWKLAF